MIVEGMPDAEYHARPELSSTGARVLLDSPARFRFWQDNPQPPKAAFDVGSAAHSLILGVGDGTVIYPDEHLTPSGAVSTKAATVAWAEEQRKNGLIPIGRADGERVQAMAEAVLAHGPARAILERLAGREVSLFQEVEGVPVRARFDLLGDGEAADLKTTGRGAGPGEFNRHIANFGYYIQRRWYDDAYEAETGRRLADFPLIVVESTPPHLVAVYDLDVMYEDAAEKKCRDARRIYRECTESGVWPGYGRSTLTAPSWVVYEDEEEAF